MTPEPGEPEALSLDDGEGVEGRDEREAEESDPGIAYAVGRLLRYGSLCLGVVSGWLILPILLLEDFSKPSYDRTVSLTIAPVALIAALLFNFLFFYFRIPKSRHPVWYAILTLAAAPIGFVIIGGLLFLLEISFGGGMLLGP